MVDFFGYKWPIAYCWNLSYVLRFVFPTGSMGKTNGTVEYVMVEGKTIWWIVNQICLTGLRVYIDPSKVISILFLRLIASRIFRNRYDADSCILWPLDIYLWDWPEEWDTKIFIALVHGRLLWYEWLFRWTFVLLLEGLAIEPRNFGAITFFLLEKYLK